MREIPQMCYLNEPISREDVQHLFELSISDKEKIITDEIYYNMGFDCGGLLTELLSDDTLGYRYWYCTRKTDDINRYDFLVYWDFGNSWSSTEIVMPNVTKEKFIQYVKENRHLFSTESKFTN